MGYIRINRKLFENKLWQENRIFSRAEAWIDLIQLVSFTSNNDKIIEGVTIKWERGQYPISYRFLSQRWNWSTHKVRIFITFLKGAGQVTCTTAWKTTILTLCNYDIYNPISQADVQADGKQAYKQTAQSIIKIKEYKEDEYKEINNKEILISDFKEKTPEEENKEWIKERDKKNAEFMARIDAEEKAEEELQRLRNWQPKE